MGLLQYTSNEMFSSTELVRKNKYIFDKLNKNEIEKAIILRDGKPNIILLDFNEYERIIGEYLELKENAGMPIIKKEDKEIQKKVPLKIETEEKIDKLEYQNALKEIEKLDFSFDSEKVKEEKNEQLKFLRFKSYKNICMKFIIWFCLTVKFKLLLINVVYL